MFAQPTQTLPATRFENFASYLNVALKKLSKICQRLAFKILPAISFQTFERSEMAKIWKLVAFKNLLTLLAFKISPTQ